MGDPGSDPSRDPDAQTYGAVVLAGGRAERLGGLDKAAARIDGRTLLERALDAVVDAVEVVVVGEQVPTQRPVGFVLEQPRYGGPVAALLTGRDRLRSEPGLVVVLAVDMPQLTPATIRRLCAGARDRDGAVLLGPDGRRQLALALRLARLDDVRPDHEGQHGMAVRTLLADLDLAEVPAVGEEHRDVDTWDDLRDLRALPGE